MGRTGELSSKIICFILALSVLGGLNGMGCLVHCAILNNFAKKISSKISSQPKQRPQTDQIEQTGDIEDHSCCVKKKEQRQIDNRFEGESLSTDLQQDSCC